MTQRSRSTTAMAAAAVVVMLVSVAALVAQQRNVAQTSPPQVTAGSPDALLGEALHEEEVEGRLQNAIAIYQKVLTAPGVTKAQAARAQFRIGACYERLGLGEARKAYEAVVANYADQTDFAAQARARLAALAEPPSRGSDPLLRQIWTTSRKVDLGQISPDGRSIVGVDWDTGDVVIRSVATGQIRRVTTIPKDRWWTDYAESPVWSRDGRRIAYWWESGGRPGQPGTSSIEFRIADVADGASRVVSVDPRFRPFALDDWSPDGSRLLARVSEGPSGNRRQHLAWVPTSGGTVQLLASADPGRDLGRAFLSPNGAWIVTCLPGDNAAVSIIAAQGGPPRPLMSAPAADSLVGWSPDGTHVLFISRESGDVDLMAARMVDGRTVDPPVRIRTLPAFNWIDVSQSGALVYQGLYRSRTNVYRASFDKTSGQVGPPSRLDVSTGLSSGSVSWSPDGRRLAWVSWPDGKPARTLSIWSADSGQARSFSLPFSAKPWSFSPTTWSADGRLVYASEGSNDTTRDSLHRIDTETGAVETVLPPGSGAFFFREPDGPTHLAGWSPDGHVVYKVVNVGGFSKVVVATVIEHRVADHAERDLFKTDPSQRWMFDTWQVAVSPDGKELAFVVSSYPARISRIMLVPAAGGPATIFAEFSNARPFIRWTSDGRSLVIWRLGGKLLGPGEAWIRDVATGAQVNVALAVDEASDIAVSPDGKAIAYIGGHREDEGVWMLENFLPPTKPKAPTPPAETRR